MNQRTVICNDGNMLLISKILSVLYPHKSFFQIILISSINYSVLNKNYIFKKIIFFFLSLKHYLFKHIFNFCLHSCCIFILLMLTFQYFAYILMNKLLSKFKDLKVFCEEKKKTRLQPLEMTTLSKEKKKAFLFFELYDGFTSPIMHFSR